MFKPALPLAKIAAIQKLGIGVVDKIFVTFDGLSKDASRRYEFLWNNKSAKPPSGTHSTTLSSCISYLFQYATCNLILIYVLAYIS